MLNDRLVSPNLISVDLIKSADKDEGFFLRQLPIPSGMNLVYLHQSLENEVMESWKVVGKLITRPFLMLYHAFNFRKV